MATVPLIFGLLLALTADLTVHHTYGPYPGWSARTLAVGGDNAPRILWTKTDGSAALWRVGANGGFTQTTYGPFPGWTARGLAIGSDNVPRILWTSTSGQMSLWSVDTQGGYTFQNFGPYSGYTASQVAVGNNNVPRILWNNTDGSISLWNGVDGTAGYSHTEYGPYPGYTPLSLSADGSSAIRLLWNHPSDSTISLWNVPVGGGVTYQNYTNPAGYSPVGTTANDYVGNVEVLYAQPDATSTVRYINQDGSIRLDYAVAAPGASNGGGGGGGTGTATPNPHGYYSVDYTYNPGSSSSTDGAAGVGAATKSYDNSYGDTVEAARVQFNNYQSGAASAHFYGTFTAKFTWHGDADHPNSPAPAQVTVLKRSTASWATAFYSNFSGNCDTRLGQSHGAGATAGGNDSVTGYASEVKGGATFSVSCAPIVDVYGTGGGSGAYAYASASFTAAAVFMSIDGTTPDPNGTDDILVGQQCTAKLQGIPYDPNGKPSVGTITYAWNVTGVKFDYWRSTTLASSTPTVVAANANASSYSDKPALDQSTASWCWNDAAYIPTPETISFSSSITPPAGQGSAITFNGTATVVVMRPTWTATGTGGTMSVGIPPRSTGVGNGSDYYLYAGAAPGSGESAGMIWRATVSPPSGTPFTDGNLYIAQIVTPYISFNATDVSGVTYGYTWTLNGQKGLDTSYPYLWSRNPGSGSGLSGYAAGDAPNLSLADSSTGRKISANVADLFEDYIMYTAPGSAQPVPLAHFGWSTNGSATIPSTNNWANFGMGSAGPVSPSGTQNFLPSTTFPSWVLIDDVNKGALSKSGPH